MRKIKEPFIPQERSLTVRRQIVEILKKDTLLAVEISALVKIPEREVCEQLEHIRKTCHKDVQKLIVTPAECLKCGFVFKKRDRLKKPGRCPLCHKESVSEPLFTIKE